MRSVRMARGEESAPGEGKLHHVRVGILSEIAAMKVELMELRAGF
jgi:hypothetical protein